MVLETYSNIDVNLLPMLDLIKDQAISLFSGIMLSLKAEHSLITTDEECCVVGSHSYKSKSSCGDVNVTPLSRVLGLTEHCTDCSLTEAIQQGTHGITDPREILLCVRSSDMKSGCSCAFQNC